MDQLAAFVGAAMFSENHSRYGLDSMSLPECVERAREHLPQILGELVLKAEYDKRRLAQLKKTHSAQFPDSKPKDALGQIIESIRQEKTDGK